MDFLTLHITSKVCSSKAKRIKPASGATQSMRSRFVLTAILQFIARATPVPPPESEPALDGADSAHAQALITEEGQVQDVAAMHREKRSLGSSWKLPGKSKGSSRRRNTFSDHSRSRDRGVAAEGRNSRRGPASQRTDSSKGKERSRKPKGEPQDESKIENQGEVRRQQKRKKQRPSEKTNHGFAPDPRNKGRKRTNRPKERDEPRRQGVKYYTHQGKAWLKERFKGSYRFIRDKTKQYGRRVQGEILHLFERVHAVYFENIREALVEYIQGKLPFSKRGSSKVDEDSDQLSNSEGGEEEEILPNDSDEESSSPRGTKGQVTPGEDRYRKDKRHRPRINRNKQSTGKRIRYESGSPSDTEEEYGPARHSPALDESDSDSDEGEGSDSESDYSSSKEEDHDAEEEEEAGGHDPSEKEVNDHRSDAGEESNAPSHPRPMPEEKEPGTRDGKADPGTASKGDADGKAQDSDDFVCPAGEEDSD